MRVITRAIKVRLLALAVVAGMFATGCQTTVGNYFANRGRDFGDCFVAEVGGGFGLGVEVQAAGLVHASAMVGIHPPPFTLGWIYGEGRPENRWCSVAGTDGQRGFLVYHSKLDTRWSVPDYEHTCFGLLPAVFSWTTTRGVSAGEWLWSDRWGPWAEEIRWARIHAFDIDASAYLGLLHIRAGFSPGEFLDFLLGWVGVDIAGDDWPLTPVEVPPVEPRPLPTD